MLSCEPLYVSRGSGYGHGKRPKTEKAPAGDPERSSARRSEQEAFGLQVDRLLDPKNDITLSSLQRAAAMVGRRVLIELV
jgi:hypothetical protein